MKGIEIAERVGSRWPAVHEQLGIPAEFLTNRHGPCPCCGGRDRFRYDNKGERGGFYCNGCGAGDGFALLQRFHNWDFRTARARVIEAAGLGARHTPIERQIPRAYLAPLPAKADERVLRVAREASPLIDCPDAVTYMQSRALWPLATRTSLRAHLGVDYFDESGQKVGRYPAILAAVRDVDGELVTIHRTYLQAGQKLKGYEPRKLMSGMQGRHGCAVRLQPLTGDVLGIAEGIETALSASAIYGMPVWAATNAPMLKKFMPPAAVKRLVIFADRDDAGHTAAASLTERLQQQLDIELRIPPAPSKDWNDVLMGAS